MASTQTSQPSQLPCAENAPSTIALHGWLTTLASTSPVHTPIREGESEGVSLFRYDEGSSADARPSDVWMLSFIIHTQLSLKFRVEWKEQCRDSFLTHAILRCSVAASKSSSRDPRRWVWPLSQTLASIRCIQCCVTQAGPGMTCQTHQYTAKRLSCTAQQQSMHHRCPVANSVVEVDSYQLQPCGWLLFEPRQKGPGA